MNDPESAAGSRELYERAFAIALRFATRYLPTDQAADIAHDVAIQMLALPAARVSTSLIYVAVTSKRRNLWRSRERRAAVESTYHQMLSSQTQEWAEPAAEMEMRELQERIAEVVAKMPRGMREVFLLIRDEELSYKEAAARLGINASTVHTQISRASVLLRQCVAEYNADAPRTNASKRRKAP